MGHGRTLSSLTFSHPLDIMEPVSFEILVNKKRVI